MDGSSDILRHPTIALIDIVRTEPRAWTTDPSNPINERREVNVEARVIEYLKGSGPHGDIAFVVTQRRPATGRAADYYGPWSSVDLEARPRLLAFLTRAVPATAEPFGSDDNFVTRSVGDRFNPKALEDVRGALRLSSRKDFPQMLRGGNIDPELVRHLPDAGYLFANFVRDTADVQTLEALLGVSEASSSFREVLLTHRVDQLNLTGGSDADYARLARILLEILQESGEHAKPLQWVVAQTYLQNVIFDISGHARITPTEVFGDSHERQAVDGLLETHPFSNDVRLLVSDWANRY